MDLDDLPLRPIASFLMGALRFLIWLVADLLPWLLVDVLVHAWGWRIGWCVCRVLTVGFLPRAALDREDDASALTRLGVEIVGITVLVVGAWAIASRF